MVCRYLCMYVYLIIIVHKYFRFVFVEVAFPVQLTWHQLMDSGEHLAHSLLALDPVALELGTEKDNATILRKLLLFNSACISKDMHSIVLMKQSLPNNFMFVWVLPYSYLVQNIWGPKLLWFSQFLLEPQMFPTNFSVLPLVDIVLMQTWKFFCEYLYGDLTRKVLAIKYFVQYIYIYGSNAIILLICVSTYIHASFVDLNLEETFVLGKLEFMKHATLRYI